MNAFTGFGIQSSISGSSPITSVTDQSADTPNFWMYLFSTYKRQTQQRQIIHVWLFGTIYRQCTDIGIGFQGQPVSGHIVENFNLLDTKKDKWKMYIYGGFSRSEEVGRLVVSYCKLHAMTSEN